MRTKHSWPHYVLGFGFTLVVTGKAHAVGPLYRTPGWRDYSTIGPNSHATGSGDGIGGISLSFANTPPYAESDISYAQGKLTLKLAGQPARVFVVDEAEVVQMLQMVRAGVVRVEASIDRVPLDNPAVAANDADRDPFARTSCGTLKDGQNEIVELKDCRQMRELASDLLAPDQDYAAAEQTGNGYPIDAPEHPAIVQARMLKSPDSGFGPLTAVLSVPPMSWPQIHVTFNPDKSEGVDLTFNPELKFMSAEREDIDLEALSSTHAGLLALAEQPYAALRNDVSEHPGRYLRALPTLKRAADLAAAFGIMRGACRAAGSCAQLPQTMPEASARKDVRPEPQNNQPNEAVMLALIEGDRYWHDAVDARLLACSGDDDAKRLACKYDLVMQALRKHQNVKARQAIAERRSRVRELEELLSSEDAKHVPSELLQQARALISQADNLPDDANAHERSNEDKRMADRMMQRTTEISAALPDADPELEIMSAAIHAWNNEPALASGLIDAALEHSAAYPVERAEVAEQALQLVDMYLALDEYRQSHRGFFAKYVTRRSASSREELVKLLRRARVATFSALNAKLDELETSNTSSENIRQIEFRARRSLLGVCSALDEECQMDLSQRDLGVLFGRFSYLIGRAELQHDRESAINRLRLVWHYKRGSQSDGWFSRLLQTLHLERDVLASLEQNLHERIRSN